MRALALDCVFGIDGVDESSFDSNVSVYDYDIVVWDPYNSLQEYLGSASTYMGLPSLTERMSAQLVRDVARRRKEFADAIELGRAVVVFIPGDTAVYVDSGERNYSGTGRNRAVTRLVKPFSIMQAVPVEVTLESAGGLEMEIASETIASVFRKTEAAWAYRSIIGDDKTHKPLLYVKGTKKRVGVLIRHSSSGGMLLLLPDFMADQEEDEDERHGGTAIQPPAEEYLAFFSWLQELTEADEASLPAWCDAYQFPTEEQRHSVQATLERQIAELSAKVEALRAEAEAERLWKTLVGGSGTPLERQVERAFAAFGFTVEPRDAGRGDLRASYGDQLAVVEVKGLSGSAGERNAAQLEKWVAAEAADGRAAKGILVVNSWRETPLHDRQHPTFPHQMLEYSSRRGHCLVSGLQLLHMVRTCLADVSRCDEVAKTLLETIGPVDGWGDVADVFEPVPTVEAAAGEVELAEAPQTLDIASADETGDRS